MLGEHFTDPFDEIGGDLLVPQETPIRQVYRSLGLYSRQNPRDRSRPAPKVLRDESDSEVSQLEEAKNERILPLMSFRVHPSAPLRSLLNPAVLDVDRMTYEELLALGEFIGNVSKGLSKEQIAVFFTAIL